LYHVQQMIKYLKPMNLLQSWRVSFVVTRWRELSFRSEKDNIFLW